MSTKRIRTGVSELVAETFADFSDGIVGYQSDLAAPIRHLRRANNVAFDRRRGLGIRRGYRDTTDYALSAPGHSLMKYYNAAANRTFVAAAAKIFQISESTGYTEQTPLPVTPTSNWWHYVNINGALATTQEGGTNSPIVYNGTAWLSMVYPTPDSTAITAAIAAGGSVDTGTHAYRVRWLFSNGASLVSGFKNASPTAGVNTVNLSTIPISARSDYIGFQIERQKLLDSVTWYLVGTVINPLTTTFSDAASDASLGTSIAAQPGPYGQAPHFENLAVYRGRLIGMVGGMIWPSQALAETAYPGAGLFNFNPARAFPASEVDDGDAIVTWAMQVDRLVMLKGKSIHALSGYDLDSFAVTPLHFGAGAAGTRAACAHGPNIYFYDGDDRLFVLAGNEVRPIGVRQVGHYLKEISTSVSLQAGVVMKNHMGRKILVAYPAGPSTYNNEVLKLRCDDGRWEHDTNIRITDALVQARRDDFAGASMIYCDPLIQSASVGQGGAANPSFVAWLDKRAATWQFYGQKLDSLGARAFVANGVQLTGFGSNPGPTEEIVVASDPTGDAFYVAYSSATGNSVAKVSNTGTNVWTATLTGGAVGARPAICVDAGGSVFVLFLDGSQSARVQKFNAAGAPQYAGAGIQVFSGGGTGQGVRSFEPGLQIWPYGVGGVAIVAPYYNNPNHSWRVSLLDAVGAPLVGWTLAGSDSGDYYYDAANPVSMPVCRASDGAMYILRGTNTNALVLQRRTSANVLTTSANLNPAGVSSIYDMAVVPGASADCLVAFIQPGTPHKLYVMRVTSALVPVWSNPVLVKTYAGTTTETFTVVQDGAGGIIVATDDYVAGVASITVTRIDVNGAIQWSVSPTTTTNARLPKIITDGGGGCIVHYLAGASAFDVYAQRIKEDGTIAWPVAGVAVGVAANDQVFQRGAFTASPQAESPLSFAPGYHVWSAYDGTSDGRPRAVTSVGDGIPWLAELPQADNGEPDTVKDIEAVEIHPATGIASLNVGIRMDDGRQVAVPVLLNVAGPKWGGSGHATQIDTLFWGPASGANPTQPHVWGGQNATGPPRAGVPPGVTGRKYTLTFSATVTDDLGIDGAVVDYRRQPDRTFA